MEDLPPDVLQKLNKKFQSLLQEKEHMIKELHEKIESLNQQIINLSFSSDEEYKKYQTDVVSTVLDQNRNYYSKKSQLEMNYLKLRGKYRLQAAQIKYLNDRLAPPSPKSSSKVDIEKLENEVKRLESLVSCHEENEEDLRGQLEEAHNEIIEEKGKHAELRIKTEEAFNQLLEKLSLERGQKRTEPEKEKSSEEIQKLQETIQEKEETIKQLNAQNEKLSNLLTDTTTACETFKANQNELYENLSKILNTEPNPQSIVGSIQHLITLPSQIELLKQQLNASNHPPEDQPKNDILIDSLKEIIKNFSPDELNLQPRSELKQLFAALVNMLNAAIKPNPDDAMLKPHIRAVVYQARYFVGRESENPLPNMNDKRSSPSTVSEFMPRT